MDTALPVTGSRGTRIEEALHALAVLAALCSAACAPHRERSAQQQHPCEDMRADVDGRNYASTTRNQVRARRRLLAFESAAEGYAAQHSLCLSPDLPHERPRPRHGRCTAGLDLSHGQQDLTCVLARCSTFLNTGAVRAQMTPPRECQEWQPMSGTCSFSQRACHALSAIVVCSAGSMCARGASMRVDTVLAPHTALCRMSGACPT